MNAIPSGTGADTRAIGFEMKKWFFDTRWAKVAVDKTARTVLSKFGAFVRTSARSSIPSSNTVSRPGQPPHSHIGAPRRAVNRHRKANGAAPIKGGRQGIKDIWFAWDQGHKSVVVGAIKYNMLSFGTRGEVLHGTLPEILEYGGDIGLMEHQRPGVDSWRRIDFRFARRRYAGHKVRRRTVHIAARPYMVPALTREKPKLPGMWADAIH